MFHVKSNSETRYEMINTIPSPTLRNQLTFVVTNLERIQKEVSHFVQDQGEIEMVDRYCEYLDRSIQSKSLLTKRSQWLCSYGQYALSRMEMLRNSVGANMAEQIPSDHADFVEEISSLVETIHGVCCSTKISGVSCDLLFETTSAIVRIVSEIKPSQRGYYYKTIRRDVAAISNYITDMKKVSIDLEPDFIEYLSREIAMLYSKMTNYAYRKNAMN